VHSEESEAVSELKNITGSDAIPSGTLANGAEGIKDAIKDFNDARKSDIENERLPPDLVDASEVEGYEDFAASPVSPRQSGDYTGRLPSTPMSPEVAQRPRTPATPTTPASPGTPADGGSIAGGHRKGHSRTSSLGTTMTSPSTRRRSLESTVTMIREACVWRVAGRCGRPADGPRTGWTPTIRPWRTSRAGWRERPRCRRRRRGEARSTSVRAVPRHGDVYDRTAYMEPA
jgi:hypothetical protein